MSRSMSASQEAFDSHFADLVNEVQSSVPSVADECRQASIISGDLYDELVELPCTNKDKARKLLKAISARIESQDEMVEVEKCVFKQFVGILRKEPSFDEIADRLETAHVEVEDRANNVNIPCTEEPDDDDESEAIHIQVISRTTEVSKGVSAFTSTVSTKDTAAVGESPEMLPYSIETVHSLSATPQTTPGQQVIGGDGGLRQRKLSSTPKELSRAIEHLQEVRSQAIADVSTISQFEEQCQGLKQELCNALAEKNQVIQRLKSKERELRELLNQKHMMEFDLNSRVTDSEYELEVERFKKEQCEEKCRVLQQKIESCRQENRELSTELEKWKEKETSLLQQVDKLNRDVQTLQTLKTKLAKKKAKYKRIIAYGRLLTEKEWYVTICSRFSLVVTVVCLAGIIVVLIVLTVLYINYYNTSSCDTRIE